MRGIIDWVSVLEEHGVNYRARGANVAGGNINVHCPWCGGDDPSYHLGISLNGAGYGCWRNSKHRGRAPGYLLRALFGTAATEILRKYGITASSVPRAPADVAEPIRPSTLEYPDGVCEYHHSWGRAWLDYLTVERGFNPEDLHILLDGWKLRCGRFGKYAGRLIIPYLMREQPVFFTARAIRDAELRYKAMPHDEAVINPKHILFHHDAIDSPGGIVVCEGQLDAIKATMYGPLPAVALSSNHATKEQLAALRAASRIYLVLDNDRWEIDPRFISEQGLSLYHDLIKLDVPAKLVPMPRGFKDLASIPFEEYPSKFTLEYLCA